MLLFSRSMMVSSGLAGAHVQPCPRNKIFFVSCERIVMLSGERSARSELRSEPKHPCLKSIFREEGSVASLGMTVDVRLWDTGPVAQVARAHP